MKPGQRSQLPQYFLCLRPAAVCHQRTSSSVVRSHKSAEQISGNCVYKVTTKTVTICSEAQLTAISEVANYYTGYGDTQ